MFFWVCVVSGLAAGAFLLLVVARLVAAFGDLAARLDHVEGCALPAIRTRVDGLSDSARVVAASVAAASEAALGEAESRITRHDAEIATLKTTVENVRVHVCRAEARLETALGALDGRADEAARALLQAGHLLGELIALGQPFRELKDRVLMAGTWLTRDGRDAAKP